MKYQRITVGMDYVFEQVRDVTGYFGAKLMKTAEDFDRVSAIEPDLPMLRVLASDAVLTLSVSAGRSRVRSHSSADIKGFTIEALCEEGDEALTGELVRSFVAGETVARWLRIVDPESDACEAARQYADSRLEMLIGRIPEPEGPVKLARRRAVPPM